MKKVKISRVVFLIAVFLLLVAGIVLMTKFVIGLFSSDKPKPTTSSEPIVSEPSVDVDHFTVELENYEIFSIDDVDFNFVLVDLKVSDTEAIDYKLSSLYTDESSVKIADYQKYIDELDALGYYVGAKNVDYDLKSDKTSDTFRIFVPVLDKNKTDLTIYDAVSKAEITIDLTKNSGNPEELKYTTGDEGTISTQDYEIKVANAYVETSLIKDGQEYSYPSTVQIYCFVLDVIRLSEEALTLEDAVFVPSGSQEEYHALDASIMSMKINNFMSRKIQEGDRGALFFEMYNPQDSGISYSGTLRLKFSNSENWLIIETEMN